MATKTQINEAVGKLQQQNDGPSGSRLELFSAGRLNPGAGDRVRESHGSEYCGQAWGRIFAAREEKSRLVKGQVDTAFDGLIYFKNAAGTRGRAATAYLPWRLQQGILGGLKAGAAYVEFAVELWVEYDPRPTNQIKFRYVVYDLLPAGEELDGIAIAAGILPPPTRQIMPPESESYDPDTGEIEAKGIEDGLTAILKGEGRREAAE